MYKYKAKSMKAHWVEFLNYNMTQKNEQESTY